MTQQQIMSLKWEFVNSGEERDIRTFNAFFDVGKDRQSMHLYKFRTIPGVIETITTFHRWNPERPHLSWDEAGEVHWMRNLSGYAMFGSTKLQFHELRRRKKATSKSRRFIVRGHEFKWKLAENGADMTCVDSDKNVVGAWTQSTQILRFNEAGQWLLDHLVVTCLINLWFRGLGRW